MDLEKRIHDVIRPMIEDQGYRLVDVVFRRAGKHSVLQVFIYAPTGIGIDDCEHISRLISPMLDVYVDIPGSYRLEVSSPGIDRKFRHIEEADVFENLPVIVHLRENDTTQTITGTVHGYQDNQVLLQTQSGERAIDWNAITTIRLDDKEYMKAGTGSS